MRGPGGTKRQKERARLEKRAEKERRKAERRAETKEKGEIPPGEDPDIAGIVPGPQPRPWEDEDVDRDLPEGDDVEPSEGDDGG